jgi:cytochrome c2
MLHNIFGKTAGQQRGFIKFYSQQNRNLGYQWSKQRLFCLLGILGIEF